MLGIIIQARTGATRLPHKLMLPFYDNKGILELIINKIKKSFIDVPIIIATTAKIDDDIITQIASKTGVDSFRGSEEDVLERFIQCANKYSISKIIRICADNPFIDMSGLKHLITHFYSDNSEYVCYALDTKVPTITTHYGFWAEGVTFNALIKIRELTNEPIYHEHVTNFIYKNSNQFQISYIPVPEYIEKTKLRLTLDTIQDFNLLKEIYLAFSKQENDSLEDLVTLVNDNKEWLSKMQQQIYLNEK